ncbi:unnamed protein product [Miscanthus lutarioriparius]|uniref:Reverse transcriptase domain-containing protein n=1 Tax=Miscanthus lutarioriparius TaxID=422564 RepID=A0A811Q2S3_9POAL|nr:unnamed protein product [Miscanthus lutarioriparius]
MDILSRIFDIATEEGHLTPLKVRQASLRLSLYADNAVRLTNPVKTAINCIMEIMKAFGDATGLRINMAKSSVATIRCAGQSKRKTRRVARTACQRGRTVRIGKVASLIPANWNNSSTMGDWFTDMVAAADPSILRPGLQSMVTLTIWEIWRERNNLVFRKETRTVWQIMYSIQDEARTWRFAGNRDIDMLLPASAAA